MRLFVDGRDIDYISFGNLDSGEYKKYTGESETYLKSLDSFLKTCGKTIDSLEEAHMMVGEGSSTALRASLAILNTLRFTKRLQLYGYTAPRGEDVFEVVRSGALQGEFLEAYAMPVYAHGPRMTPTRKDQLNRKI